MPAQRLTYDDAIAFSDPELVERLWSRIGDIEDDHIYGDLCLFVDELTERQAPQIARLNIERTSASSSTRTSRRCDSAKRRG
ncbi:MAG: hypothetical protein AUH17_01915 [Actinobacteria bacterium 13_2_20CM_68_14]|nr:MAG: hypothetical protein AUH17_01915 [Actinobacteria bacterium 13_2_20CM_68_14]